MICSRRIYKGGSMTICLPLPFDPEEVSEVLLSFFTDDVYVVTRTMEDMEIDVTGGTMCVVLDPEEVELFPDGVLHYTISYVDENGNTVFDEDSPGIVIKTPTNYEGQTLDELIDEAYNNGYVDGIADCHGYDSGYTDGYEAGYEDGYASGYTDGLAACESGDTGDTPTAETRYFTITNTSRRNGVITLEKVDYSGNEPSSGSVTYRTSRDGINWTEPITYTATTSFSIPAGEYLMFDGDENNYQENASCWYAFTNNTRGLTFKISGDISTLLGGREDLPDGGFNGIFRGWTTLVDASELNLDYMTIAKGGYMYMFYDCENLIQAPILPAINLGEWCYQSMFEGCTSLNTAPELPATVLARGCYISMFEGCENLIQAPVLPASNILSDSYAGMFHGCTSLTSVTCYGREMTPITGGLTPITAAWLAGIETTGVFYCYHDLLSYWNEHRDGNGVPETWSIRIAEPYNQQNLTIEALGTGHVYVYNDSLYPRGTMHVRKNYDTWTDYDNWTTIIIDVNEGDTVEFRAAYTNCSGITFEETCLSNVFGNIWSLVFDDDLPADEYFSAGETRMFDSLFNSSRIVDASNLWLGGKNTYIPQYCFRGMFQYSYNLVAAPELPMMTNLQPYCYTYMFLGCNSLENAPELPATWVPEGAYSNMFMNCSSLNFVKCDLEYIDNNTNEWLYGVAESGVFIKNPDANWSYGPSGIPYGWTVFDYLFESDTDHILANFDATSITITIKALHNWRVTSNPSWASPNRTSAQAGETNVRIDIQSGITNRSGEIVFTDSEGNIIRIAVAQAEVPAIYIDDFPDGTDEDFGYLEPYDPDFCEDFYGYSSFPEYFQNYVANMRDRDFGSGVNIYEFAGEMTHNGTSYYLYKLSGEDNGAVTYGLVAKNKNKSWFQSNSMVTDITKRVNPFDYLLSSDGEVYDTSERPAGWVLIDID